MQRKCDGIRSLFFTLLYFTLILPLNKDSEMTPLARLFEP